MKKISVIVLIVAILVSIFASCCAHPDQCYFTEWVESHTYKRKEISDVYGCSKVPGHHHNHSRMHYKTYTTKKCKYCKKTLIIKTWDYCEPWTCDAQ